MNDTDPTQPPDDPDLPEPKNDVVETEVQPPKPDDEPD
jgi:hypothetical protein